MIKRNFISCFCSFDLKKAINVFIVAFLFVINCYTQVIACTPSTVTPWFTEEYEVENISLPKGISYAQTDGNEKYSDLVIYNTSGNPILITEQDGKTITSVSDTSFLLITDYQDHTNDGVTYILESRNIIGDKRPNDIKIPDSQHVNIPMQVGRESFILQVKITYTLNKNYRIDSVYDSDSCQRFYVQQFWNNTFLPIFLISLGVIGLGFAAKYNRLRKKQISSNLNFGKKRRRRKKGN